jgi:APA family basic amino acid/polyamine antiporter
VLACFGYYAWYRRKHNLPIIHSVKHDWEAQQQQVLADAEEFDLLERYRGALAARDRAREEASG